jgi:hypothetical protein
MIGRKIMNQSLEDNIEKCINALLEKFLKWPLNFFTESDAHSYLYYYFFRFGSKEIKKPYHTNDSKRTVLIHREYPTSFRYRKETMQLDEKKGGRGHYDLVVLDPEFVKAHKLKQVIAKNYKTDCVNERLEGHLPYYLSSIFLISSHITFPANALFSSETRNILFLTRIIQTLFSPLRIRRGGQTFI